MEGKFFVKIGRPIFQRFWKENFIVIKEGLQIWNISLIQRDLECENYIKEEINKNQFLSPILEKENIPILYWKSCGDFDIIDFDRNDKSHYLTLWHPFPDKLLWKWHYSDLFFVESNIEGNYWYFIFAHTIFSFNLDNIKESKKNLDNKFIRNYILPDSQIKKPWYENPYFLKYHLNRRLPDEIKSFIHQKDINAIKGDNDFIYLNGFYLYKNNCYCVYNKNLFKLNQELEILDFNNFPQIHSDSSKIRPLGYKNLLLVEQNFEEILVINLDTLKEEFVLPTKDDIISSWVILNDILVVGHLSADTEVYNIKSKKKIGDLNFPLNIDVKAPYTGINSVNFVDSKLYCIFNNGEIYIFDIGQWIKR